MKFLHSFLRRHLAGKSVRRQMSAVFSGYSESSDQNFFVYILYYLLIISYHMKSYHIISYHIISYHIISYLSYNLPINFCSILLAILGYVVPSRRAGIRQYTPSVSIFALRFFSGKKARHKVNKVSLFSVFVFFNNLK